MLGLGESSIKGVISHEVYHVTILALYAQLEIILADIKEICPCQIVASYTTTSGETKTSLLLTSGW